MNKNCNSTIEVSIIGNMTIQDIINRSSNIEYTFNESKGSLKVASAFEKDGMLFNVKLDVENVDSNWLTGGN